MNRVFISIGKINIYWYSVLILLSILIGFLIVKKEVKKTKLNYNYLIDLIFYLIPICILGARIYYVIFNFSIFKNNLIDIFKIWEGGLAIYGAVISGIIFIIYYAKKKKQNILLTLDILTCPLVLGQTIGRWGNFFNQEAYGTITTLENLKHLHIPNFIIQGMYINNSYHLPTFLFESIWCLLVFIILIIIKNKTKYKKNGVLIFSYFILYSIGRFFIEGLRTDSLYIFNFRISQIVSILLIIIGIIGLIIIRKEHKKCKNMTQ